MLWQLSERTWQIWNILFISSHENKNSAFITKVWPFISTWERVRVHGTHHVFTVAHNGQTNLGGGFYICTVACWSEEGRWSEMNSP